LKLKIFTLQFSDTANGFDDKPIQEFTAEATNLKRDIFRHFGSTVISQSSKI